MKRFIFTLSSFAIFFILALFIYPSQVTAHCDTLDGPVVKAARKALETDNVNYVLIWVKPEDEDAIRKALKRALNKRRKAKSKEEKDRANLEFFETLVRIHREGEGVNYEGIKPAGTIEPEIVLADEIVETGEIDKILSKISSAQAKEIVRHLFHKVKENVEYDVDDVNAGREFIQAYVQFIHAVEKAVKGLEIQLENHHH